MKISFYSLHYFKRISGKNILDLLIEFTYLMIIFLIPLWLAYWLPTYHIFAFNKSVIFKVLISLLLFFTGIKIIFYRVNLNLKPLKFFRKYWLVPLIFIIGLSLTLWNSLNPSLSFYGLMDRQAGLVNYLFYFLWFILVSFNILTINNSQSHLNGKESRNIIGKNLQRVIIISVFSASLVSVYGILQIFNIDFLVWSEAPWLTHRIFSTLGQPNFLASYLLLLIPLSLYLFSKSHKFLIKFMYILAASIQLIALFLSGSRGGLLSLVFMAMLFLVYLLIKTSWSRLKKYLAIALFILFSLVSLWSLNYYSNGRVHKLLNLNGGSSEVRLNFYQAASTAIIHRPLQGYGLENSGSVFIKYYRPDWGVYGNVGQNTDRAHNLILDILLTTGIFGLILYSLYYYFFFSLLQDNLRNKGNISLNIALGLGASGYLFSLLFNFSMVTSEIYFWLFLALLIVINYTTQVAKYPRNLEKLGPPKYPQSGLKPFLKIILMGIITIFIFGQIRYSLKSLLADYYFNSSYIAIAQSNYLSALVLERYMLSEGPNPINLQTYYVLLGNRLSDSYSSIDNLGTKRLVKQNLQKINEFLPAEGYRNLLVKAKIDLILHNFTLAQTYLSKIIIQTPYWPLAYLEAGKLDSVQGNFKAALVNYHLAALNLPNPNDSRLNFQHHRDVLNYQYIIAKQIAQVYEQEKNYTAAEKYYKLAYTYNPADFTLFKEIANTYYERGNLKLAILYVKRGQKRNLQDYHWPWALAILFNDLGKHSLAKNYLKQALELAPQNQKLLNFQHKLINNQ